MTSPDELAGLPEDVREAVEYVERWVRDDTDWQKVRAELLRLAREVVQSRTDVRVAREMVRPFRERAERAEAELAALKRRIAEAPTATVFGTTHLTDTGVDQAGIEYGPHDTPLDDGQRVALLPVGDGG